MNTRFSDLSGAYQLHYYFCSHTRWNKPVLTEEIRKQFDLHLKEICEHENYHLLRSSVYPNNFRLLLSLRPEHQIDRVANKIKANLSRKLNEDFSTLGPPPLWGRGYLVRSIGRKRQETVEAYITKQKEHHGYKNPKLITSYETNAKLPEFWSRNHVKYNLTYHIVLAAQNRKPIFDVDSGKVLVAKWLEVSRAQNVIISRLKLMPEHVHLLVHLIPTTPVLECVEMLLDCSFELMNEQFGGVLKLHEAWNVWEHSFYAGTLGTVTTAQVDRFLAGRLR
ncbi:MAG: IS200/IS605 family transposase [candidate division KSB1 bacterium]|nr:IS200/IS605 family transposase [candidate division KSB1 bacterium]